MSLPVLADTLGPPLACAPCHSCQAQHRAKPPRKTLALAVVTPACKRLCLGGSVWSRFTQQSWCPWPGIATKRPAGCLRGWQSHTLEVSRLTNAFAHPVAMHMDSLSNAKMLAVMCSLGVDCGKQGTQRSCKAESTRQKEGYRRLELPGLGSPCRRCCSQARPPASAGSPVQSALLNNQQ